MRSLCIFLGSLLLMSACSDSEELDYTGTYVSVSVKAGSTRMFTQKGEVKKKSLIEDFIPTDIARDFFILSDPPEVKDIYSIEFSGNDVAEFTESGHPESKTLIRKGQVMYLESLETGYLFREYNGETLLENFGKYKPLYADTTLLSYASGYRYMIEVKECVYLEPSGSEIHLPLLSYYYKRSYPVGGYSSRAARFNNSLNKDILKELSANDTIVVQQCRIVFKKQ